MVENSDDGPAKNRARYDASTESEAEVSNSKCNGRDSTEGEDSLAVYPWMTRVHSTTGNLSQTMRNGNL